LQVLQFNEPLPDRMFEALNRDFFPLRPDVELRAYGFYGGVCDLSFCSLLSNVRRFAADCIQSARGVENLARMPLLRALCVGIFDLEDLEFLRQIPECVEELTIGETRSKKLDLTALARFRLLRRLGLVGQQKNIEAIAGHPALQELVLRSITLPSVTLLRTIPNLFLLDIGLGGSRDLSGLEGMGQLRSLHLWRILGLEDIGVVSTLVGLQELQLQELSRVRNLPNLEKLVRLRRIVIDNLKNLLDISVLKGAPALCELAHYSAKVDPESYVPLFQIGRIEHAQIGFGGTKKNARFSEICASFGIKAGALPCLSLS
jgi:hypothetical protein